VCVYIAVYARGLAGPTRYGSTTTAEQVTAGLDLQAFTAILTGKELLVTVVDADVIAAEPRILRLVKSNSLVRPIKLVQVVTNYV
jgi:hypothetical protein